MKILSLVFTDLYYFASSVSKRFVFGLDVSVSNFGESLGILTAQNKRILSESESPVKTL